ncbi:NlpC/P60 family protein [Serratia oryzae]|uniref:NlpC/P60 family protein n=1 Tax=Serratia oryzae TaxID=2034155 RepID=UPI0012E23FFA|nr:NlpC/P60 family protein [Serratia oryzae]
MAKNVFATKADVEKLIKQHGDVFNNNQNLLVTGLNKEQTLAYALGTMHNESDGKQHVINNGGYVGLFQFGAPALVDAGLIKRDKYDAYLKTKVSQKVFLSNKDNWTIVGGLDAFLNDGDLQYKTFIKNSNRNISAGEKEYKSYVRNAKGKLVLDRVFPPALNANSSAVERAGFAMGAHLKGATGANRYYHLGNNGRDGNQVEISSYVERGKRAVNDLSSTTAQFLAVGSSAGGESKSVSTMLARPAEIEIENNSKEKNAISQPLPLTQEIKDKYKNTLYKYGANGNQANGNTLYDCSHLTHAIGKELGHNVPYQSTAELAKSKYYDIIDPKDVKPGDLALWRGKDNHVGVVETPIGSDGTGTYFSTRGNDKKPGRSGTVKFGPKSGYWKKPTSYLRIKPEYVNQAPIKNTVVAQKKSSPPKVAPAPVVEKNSADIAKEKKLPRGYDLLGGMVSALRQLTVPNLQHATQALLGRQPEDYRSAKGGCCCASGPTSPVINQNTSITLNSACKDPQELGKIVTSAQDRVNRDMVRKITPRTS